MGIISAFPFLVNPLFQNQSCSRKGWRQEAPCLPFHDPFLFLVLRRDIRAQILRACDDPGNGIRVGFRLAVILLSNKMDWNFRKADSCQAGQRPQGILCVFSRTVTQYGRRFVKVDFILGIYFFFLQKLRAHLHRRMVVSKCALGLICFSLTNSVCFCRIDLPIRAGVAKRKKAVPPHLRKEVLLCRLH